MLFPTSQPCQSRPRSVMTISTTNSNAVPSALRKRKAHTKSRRGCSSCKTRRVKCDENKPTCDQCNSKHVVMCYDIGWKSYLLLHSCRVRCVLRVWWQSSRLEVYRRKLLRLKSIDFLGFRSVSHDEYFRGQCHLSFVELPTAEPILHHCCTLQCAS